MKKLNITLLLIASMFFTSCAEDWLDVNDNPNAATNVPSENLFGYAAISWSGNRQGGDSYLPIAFMNQTISTGGNIGWEEIDPYDISPYSLGNTWKMYYATSGANLIKAIELAETNKFPNKAAQSKILLAAMMFECTMIYGDIPFSEAWKPTINEPKFDPQKEVLESLISLLNEAKDQIEVSSNLKISDEDLFYKGDLDKWKKFANSLVFKIAMVMVDKDPSKSTLIAEKINEGMLITTPDQNAMLQFYDTPGQENPLYRILGKYNNGVNEWFFANNTVLDELMLPNDDPRIEKYYTKGANATDYKAVKSDEPAVKDVSALISTSHVITPDAPDIIVSAQEINFLIAEAYARGLGVSMDLTKAEMYFNTALEQSLEYNEVDQEVISEFVANDKFNLASSSNPIKVIHEQQYVDLANRHIEAWVQMRRSGPKGQEVPNLSTPRLSTAPNGEVARRWTYPPDELTGNGNAPKDIPKIWEAMWFDL